MARRCVCSVWDDRVRGDMGFLALPAMFQLIWFRLRLSFTAPGAGGRIRFLGSVTQSVSGLLSVPEPEVRTALETLVTLGFLEWDEAAGTVGLPGAEEGDARAAAARVSGLKGGRPRTGETKEQARERREREAAAARAQQHLPLPVTGGKALAETQAEPEGESSCAGGAKPSSPEEAKPAMPWPEIQKLGDELADIAGLDTARSAFTFVPVKDWYGAGASPDLMRQVVRRLAERPGYVVPRSLAYFAPAMREALESGERVVAVSSSGATAESSPAFAAYVAWCSGGMVGPMPQMPAKGAA